MFDKRNPASTVTAIYVSTRRWGQTEKLLFKSSPRRLCGKVGVCARACPFSSSAGGRGTVSSAAHISFLTSVALSAEQKPSLGRAQHKEGLSNTPHFPTRSFPERLCVCVWILSRLHRKEKKVPFPLFWGEQRSDVVSKKRKKLMDPGK